MRAILRALCLLSCAGSTLPGQQSEVPRYLLGDVGVGAGVILFTARGSIWEVPRDGGTARSLPIQGPELRFPLISPDGRKLAFTRAGALWVLDRESGVERRLTWHPNISVPRAWSPDGRKILFTAARGGVGSTSAYEVGAEGGLERRLPFSPVRFAAYEPGGSRLAIIGRSHFALGIDRRFYRGGNRDPLTLVREGERRAITVASASTNLVQPMWLPQGLFILSDSLGAFNLARVDLPNRRLQLVTHWRSFGVTSAAAASDAIVLVRDGTIVLVDPASGRARTVPVLLPPIHAEPARPVSLVRFTSALALGVGGRQLAIESRGEIFRFDIARQALARLTSTSSTAERNPVLSPDGTELAFFSDAGGEYALVIARASDGQLRQRIELPPPASFPRELTWSPDGRHLAFSDLQLRLLVANRLSATASVVDSATWVAQDLWQLRWSPDSRTLAYGRADANGLRSIWMRDMERGTSRRLSSTGTDDSWPVFGANGETLFYAASVRSANAYARGVWALESDQAAQPIVTHQLMQVRWRAPEPRPQLVQFGARTIEQMWPRDDGALLVQARQWQADGPRSRALSELLSVDPASGISRKVADGLRGVDVSPEGGHALLIRGGGWSVISLKGTGEQAAVTEETLEVGGLTFEVDVQMERRQMYAEAFRLMRDVFYDPGLHGASLLRLEEHFAAYLPGLQGRADLNELLLRAFGEISVSHLEVFGGDLPREAGTDDRVGLLGVDVEPANGRLRLARIHRPPPSAIPGLDLPSPVGVDASNVREGEYILAVNGQEVRADRPWESYLVGTAGTTVTLRVGPSPTGEGARDANVRPVPDDAILRRRAWAHANAERVAAKSKGRVAYVYIHDWDEAGLAEFYRVFNGLRDDQGLIIDQRWNSGGITPDGVIAALTRSPLYAYHFRHGGNLPIPLHRTSGPKVLIANEGNGSAAETFALMFRRAGVGISVGRRTIGGGIGASLFAPRLIDGGIVAIPNRAAFDPVTGTWAIENQGIAPDVRVELPLVEEGSTLDAQLESALREALRRLPAKRPTSGPIPRAPRHPPREGTRAACARACHDGGN